MQSARPRSHSTTVTLSTESLSPKRRWRGLRLSPAMRGFLSTTCRRSGPEDPRWLPAEPSRCAHRTAMAASRRGNFMADGTRDHGNVEVATERSRSGARPVAFPERPSLGAYRARRRMGAGALTDSPMAAHPRRQMSCGMFSENFRARTSPNDSAGWRMRTRPEWSVQRLALVLAAISVMTRSTQDCIRNRLPGRRHAVAR